MSRAVDRVIAAWTDEGPYPPDHHKAIENLKRDWPTLAGALEDLCRDVQKTEFDVGDRVYVNAPSSRYNGEFGVVVGEAPDWSSFEYRVQLEGYSVKVSFLREELLAV